MYPIKFILYGRVTEAKPEHFSNAEFPIVDVPDGIVIEVKPLHELKAESPMDVNPT